MGLPVVHRESPCHSSNYRSGRKAGVEYLVIHYVGATGDAKANARYYGSTANIGASAHYFVGHGPSPEVWQSVAEGDTAWHVGAKRYLHSRCRNDNSIGIELCCHQDGNGVWYFDPATVEVGIQLARDIVERYGLSREQVLRHYDVTGKRCPEPFVRDGAAWEEFKERVFAEESGEESVKIYTKMEQLPAWCVGAVERAVEQGYIKLDGAGNMALQESNLQPLVWMDRCGLFDQPAKR